MQDNQQELSPEVESLLNETEKKMNQGNDSPMEEKKPLPAEVVEKTWQRIATLLPQDAQKLIKRMTKEQPVI